MTSIDTLPEWLRITHLEAAELGRGSIFQSAAGKSVLITGASGMVGTYLALAFLYARRQHRLDLNVYGLSRNMERAKKHYADLPLIPISRDVSASLDGLPRFDYVIHAASPVGPALFASDPVGIVTANLTGTLALLAKAVRDQTQRFLFVSTHEVYGQGQSIWREEDSGILDFFSPRSCYPESKRAGENACVCFHQQYGLHSGIARLSRVMGPNMNLDSGLFICDFLKDALAKRAIIIKGNGNLVRPLCHIADVAAGLATILFAGDPGKAYNVAPTEASTLVDIAQELAQLAGTDIRLAGTLGIGEGMTQKISRLRALGWEPKIPLREGLARVWSALNAHPKP